MINSASALISQVSSTDIDSLLVLEGTCARMWLHPGTRERATTTQPRSIAVVIRLERTHLVHADVARLIVGQHRQFSANTAQMQARNLFIKVLGQNVDLVFVLVAMHEQFDLS